MTQNIKKRKLTNKVSPLTLGVRPRILGLAHGVAVMGRSVVVPRNPAPSTQHQYSALSTLLQSLSPMPSAGKSLSGPDQAEPARGAGPSWAWGLRPCSAFSPPDPPLPGWECPLYRPRGSQEGQQKDPPPRTPPCKPQPSPVLGGGHPNSRPWNPQVMQQAASGAPRPGHGGPFWNTTSPQFPRPQSVPCLLVLDTKTNLCWGPGQGNRVILSLPKPIPSPMGALTTPHNNTLLSLVPTDIPQ